MMYLDIPKKIKSTKPPLGIKENGELIWRRTYKNAIKAIFYKGVWSNGDGFFFGTDGEIYQVENRRLIA